MSTVSSLGAAGATEDPPEVARSPNIGLHYDLRRHPGDSHSNEWRHRASLEQMVLAEELGFDSIWISEHHFTEDDQSTSPLLSSAALAARTERVQIGTNILLLPLHHPVRLAEEVATLGIISAGRFTLGVGAGYNEQDFRAFGQRLGHRPSLMEEGVEILRRSWAGECVRYEGRRWILPEYRLTPLPTRAPPIFVGAFAEAAIQRAARIGDGFLAGSPASIPTYRQAMTRLHGDPFSGRIVLSLWAMIAEDPEREWASVGPHALAQMNGYVSKGGYGNVPLFADPADVIARGQYLLWDGDTAVSELSRIIRENPDVVDIQLFSRMPGESFERASERMAYISTTVLPEINAIPYRSTNRRSGGS
jgi:alkanesulfonate monooxygenase SsuD/methylene tetrahydromethanopterin reductase-like flavin-dependent oxidoreductase (luciferase family)